MMAEPKQAPPGAHRPIPLTSKRAHKEGKVILLGDSGANYNLILRQNKKNACDFSVILAVRRGGSNQHFRIRRHNGNSHQHTNRIEKNVIYGYHIHYATERYQDIGMREDSYAEATSRYADLFGAVKCMIIDAKINLPPDPQMSLFKEGDW